jgi:hypothetical protein
MSESAMQVDYILTNDEKSTPVMIYTTNALIKGNVISKEPIRVSTWLRTPMAPEYFHLLNANVLMMSIPGSMRSLSFKEYFIPIPQIVAYHLVPPHEDPLDFDETEPNRKMEPVAVMVGSFMFKGNLRMSSQINLGTHLDVAHETYYSLYDSEISNHGLLNLGKLRIPLTILRSDLVTFASSINPSFEQ